MLEKKINEVDELEPRALFLGKSRCDVNQERISVLAEADERLADYGMHLVATIDPSVMVLRVQYNFANLGTTRLVRGAYLSDA
jgi:hypothetical protein